MPIVPAVQGTCSIRRSAADFLDAMKRRVEAGLPSGRPHPRWRYAVTHAGSTALHISAVGWLTAINVGLNEVDLQVVRPGVVRYDVRYWRWARYVIALCASLGAIGLALLLFADVRGYVAAHPHGMIPGLSMDQNVLVAWASVLFWGFLWPWLLIPLHKRPLRRLIERMISEVDAGAPPASPA
jgi:hypothetical protein